MKVTRKTATYVYRDEKGRKLFERVRWQTDRPPPRHKIVTYQFGIGGDWATGYGVGDGVLIKEKPPTADRYLYHLPELLLAKATGADIWWCEGESDAGAVEVAGDGIYSTAHHGGAGSANLSQAQWLSGHTGRIFLPFDRDEIDQEGGMVGAFDVVRRFRLLILAGLSLDQIQIVGPAVGKDMRDHIDAGLGLDDVEVIEGGAAVSDLQLMAKRCRRGSPAWRRAGYGEVTTEQEIAEILERGEAKSWVSGAASA